MKKILLIFSLIFLISCSSKIPVEENYIEIKKNELSKITPTEGGEIKIPVINFNTFNPLYPSNSSSYYLFELIHESLFKYNKDGSLESNLVEHYVLSPDKRTLTLTLKDNVYFHDGSKLTTKDVLMTFNGIKAAKEGPYYENFINCAGNTEQRDALNFITMDIFDDRNIDIKFDKPYANYLDMLTFPILPSSIYNSSTVSKLENFNSIGLGPYLIEEISTDKYIKLKRNDSYYARLPYITNIYAKIFDSFDLAYLAFETGQIDLMQASGYDWNKFYDNSKIRYEEFSSNEMEYLIVNSNSQIFQGEMGKALKLAISKAINKKRIADRVYLSKADETSIPLSINKLNQFGLKSDSYYNEIKAKEILQNAGFKDENQDGFLEDLNGNNLSIEIKSNFSNSYKRLSTEFIIEDLRAIGINAYSNYDSEKFESMTAEELKNENQKFISDLKNSDFQLALATVNLGEVSDISALLHSNSIGVGLNYSNYSNENLDLILEKINLTDDRDKEKENYLNAIKIINEDVPIIPLFIKRSAILIDNRIQGEVSPINLDLYNSFKDIFIIKQFQ